MICKKCKAEIKEGSKFCCFCGEPTQVEHNEKEEIKTAGMAAYEEKKVVEEDTDTESAHTTLHTYAPDSACSNQSGRGSGKRYILLAVAVVLFIISGVFGYSRFASSKLSEYRTVYNNFNEIKDELIMPDDKTAEECNDVVLNLADALDNRNVEGCKRYSSALLSLQNELETYSVREVRELKDMVDVSSKNYLYDAEAEIMTGLYTTADEMFQKEKYKTAYDGFQQCLDLINVSTRECLYQMNLEQVDETNYPNTKLYLKVTDFSTGEIIDNLDVSKFSLMEKIKGEYQTKTIDKITLMDQAENLNIGIVADVSASMGDMLYITEDAMDSLVSSMQFNIGDRAALYSFADTVTREQYFTNDAAGIRNSIYSLTHGNMTALYDALAFSLSEIIVQDGAKCIIAFTDGIENCSVSSKEYIIEKAQRYQIPIYLIGIGRNVDAYELSDIANRTGGQYYSINEIYSMDEIYKTIYREQKAKYVLEYTTDDTMDVSEQRVLYIRYDDGHNLIRNEIKYVPEDYTIKGFIFHDSDKRYLTEAELDKLTEAEVRIALNEIYARRGYIFQTAEDMKAHFSNLDWYHGSEQDMNKVAAEFNEYEKKNVDMLVNYEIKHKLNGRVK